MVPMGLNLLLIICLWISSNLFYARSTIEAERRPRFPKVDELERSQPIRGIEFECVDIYKQPAFEHPSLKNHKVQLRPSFLKKTNERRSSDFDKSFKLDEVTDRCPSGKVPIHKRIMNRQWKTKFVVESLNKNFHTLSKEYPGHHFVTLDTTQSTTFRGASADMNLFNPPVKQGQFSMALVWLQNGPPAELNSLKVGWAVHPRLYGDNLTRLTSYWTVDNYKKTGCYNLICPGFVQVHPETQFGVRFKRMSTIGGPQYGVVFTIKQDKSTGHWWFVVENHIVIGYWPKEIFTHLANGASLVKYGGETLASPNGISPPMGSGEFPSEKYGRTGCLSALKIVNSEFNEVDINPVDMVINNDAGSNCYDLIYHGFEGRFFRQAFLFGGPGGQCGT